MMRQHSSFVATRHAAVLFGSVLLGSGALLAGCTQKDGPVTPAASEAVEPRPLASTQAPPPAAKQARARVENVENDLYQFGFGYPAQVAAIPALREMFEKRLVSAKAELEAAARSDQQEAKKDGYPYRPHSFEAEWSVVTDTPAYLSLSAKLYEYTGGAHGMSNFDALLWDRNAYVSRVPIDLFASKDALREAIQAPFCAALDKQRAGKRGEPVQRDSGQPFTECIDPVANTLILGSTDGRVFDRLGILVAPYEAGPYAEGSYEVTLPVTPAVLAAVRPEYRASFSTKH